MALSSLAALKAASSITSSTDDAALSLILAEVDAAIKRRLRSNIESATYTDIILDAPPSVELVLPETPVTTLTSVYYRSDAKGDPSLFTSTYLLTAYSDYRLVTDRNNASQSRSGIIQRLYRSMWGVTWSYPLNSIAARPVPEPGAIMVTWTAGYSTVPADIVLAVHMATIALFQRRKLGAGVSSEGWNGFNYSLGQGPATADSVLDSPEIQGLLRPFNTAMVFVA